MRWDGYNTITAKPAQVGTTSTFQVHFACRYVPIVASQLLLFVTSVFILTTVVVSPFVILFK